MLLQIAQLVKAGVGLEVAFTDTPGLNWDTHANQANGNGSRGQLANLLRVFGQGIAALATDLVDTVQVVYNVFDQAPEDLLFDVCARKGIGVIARVPLDEGSLTGTLTPQSRWPEGDFRNIYFQPPKLQETLARVAPLAALAAEWGEPLPSMALRFILAHPAVTTVIPGMRALANMDAFVAGERPPDLVEF